MAQVLFVIAADHPDSVINGTPCQARDCGTLDTVLRRKYYCRIRIDSGGPFHLPTLFFRWGLV